MKKIMTKQIIVNCKLLRQKVIHQKHENLLIKILRKNQSFSKLPNKIEIQSKILDITKLIREKINKYFTNINKNTKAKLKQQNFNPME